MNAAMHLKNEKRWAFDALCQIQISAVAQGDKGSYYQPAFKFPIIKLNPETGIIF